MKLRTPMLLKLPCEFRTPYATVSGHNAATSTDMAMRSCSSRMRSPKVLVAKSSSSACSSAVRRACEAVFGTSSRTQRGRWASVCAGMRAAGEFIRGQGAAARCSPGAEDEAQTGSHQCRTVIRHPEADSRTTAAMGHQETSRTDFGVNSDAGSLGVKRTFLGDEVIRGDRQISFNPFPVVFPYCSGTRSCIWPPKARKLPSPRPSYWPTARSDMPLGNPMPMPL